MKYITTILTDKLTELEKISLEGKYVCVALEDKEFERIKKDSKIKERYTDSILQAIFK